MALDQIAGLDRVGQGAHRVMMLHGWFGPTWSALLPYLDTSAFEYAFPYFRGYGTRKDEAGTHSLVEAATDVIELADGLGWDSFSVVGHSMGGTIMQQVLASAPGRVRSLFGISPVPASGVPFDDETWKVFTGAVGDPNLRRGIIDMTTGGRLPGGWLDAVVGSSQEHTDEAAFGAILESWAKTDFHGEIEGDPVPVKAVVGEHDPAISADLVRSTFGAWYPNFELEVMSNAGHYAPDEVPLACVASIEAFLRAH